MYCCIMGYSSQICDKIFQVLEKENPLCVCVWERSDLDWVGGLPCSHASLYYKSSPEMHQLSPVTVLTEPRLLSHCCVTHTKPEAFSPLYYYSWYSGLMRSQRMRERDKSQVPAVRYTQTHSCRCGYISAGRQNIRDFFTHLTWTDEEQDAASLEHGGWSICLSVLPNFC